jgi:ankyrin repeat protein
MYLFEDHNDWDAMEEDSLTGSLLWYGVRDGLASRHDPIRSDQRSWRHNMQKSLELASRDILLLQQLARESSITLHELFDISLAYALEGRYEQELDGLEKCAQQGYLAAQAIFAPIYAARASINRSHKPIVGLPILEWSLAAASSGYLFSTWTGSASDLQNRLPDAQGQFRLQGGYNSHYCSRNTLSPTSDVTRPSQGLVGSISDSLALYPLHVAAAYNELLTSSGPSCVLDNVENINKTDPWGYTALMRSCMSGSLDSLRILVDASADAEVANEASGVVALHWLFVFAEHEIEDAAIALQKGGACFDVSHQAIAMKALHFPFAWPSGEPLHWAVISNNAIAVDTLIRYGALIDQKDVAGQTPLHIALKMLNVEMVQFLLDRGASLNTYPEPYEAMWNDEGPDPFRTPVHDFLWSQLELGGDPDLDGYDGGDVVFPDWYDYFIFAGNEKPKRSIAVLDTILSHSPDCLHWRDSKNRTAIDYQMAHGKTHISVFQKLIDHGPPVDDAREGDFSVLFWLFTCGQFTTRWRPGEYDWELATDDRLINERLSLVLESLPTDRRASFVNRKEPDWAKEANNPFTSEHITTNNQSK